jgi:hypothetical protein
VDDDAAAETNVADEDAQQVGQTLQHHSDVAITRACSSFQTKADALASAFRQKSQHQE